MKDTDSLIFIGSLEKYIKNLDTGYHEKFLRLKAECDRYFDMDVPEIHPPKATSYMGIYIVNLALYYRLTQDEKYLIEAKRWINGVVGYEAWGFGHRLNYNLSASWLAWGLSLAYDWLEPYFTPEENDKVYAKMCYQTKLMYENIMDYKRSGRLNFCQNHNWIELNGIATTGYVMKKYKNEGDEYINIATENFKNVFALMPDDGSNYEGVSYWRYGGMWLFVYAHLAKMESNIDFFKTSKYLENTFDYRFYQSAGDKALQLDFGDCHDRYSCHTAVVYYKTAAEYNNGHAQYFGNLTTSLWLEDEGKFSKITPGILPEAGLEFLFYEPSIKPIDFNDMPKQKYFEDLGLISLRSSLDDNARVFSFKCGYPGGKKQLQSFASKEYKGMEMNLGHNHPDNLSYIFGKGRNYFTCEDRFNRNVMPTHHSTLLVDGKNADTQDVYDVYRTSLEIRLQDSSFNAATDYHGTIEYINHVDDLTIFKGVNTKIYPKDLQMNEVSRTVITNENLDFLVFIDRFKSQTEHTYSIICNTECALIENGMVKQTPMGDYTVTYAVISDKAIKTNSYTQHVEAVMTPQEPDNKSISDMFTEQNSSVNPSKEQVFVEVISENASVNCESNKITIKTYDKTYQVLIDNNDVVFTANGLKIDI